MERAAVSIGSGSVKVRKYGTHIIIPFGCGSLFFDFEKCCSVKVRQKLRKTSV